MKCTRFFTNVITHAVFAGSLLALAACSPVVANRGNLLEEDRLAQLKVGETDQSAVQALLGPPTLVATFNKNIWYYSGARTERTAFFKPEIVEERTLALQFSEFGVLENMQSISAEDKVAVKPNNRVTPTEGRAMGAVDQIIENISNPTIPTGATRSRQPGEIRR